MVFRFILLFTYMFLFLSCEETLPPRNEPLKVLEGVIKPESKRIPVFKDTIDIDRPGQDSTAIEIPKKPLQLSVGVSNVFDETLQDTQNINITLNLWVINKPTVNRTLTHQLSNTRNILTIDPGDTHWVTIEWNHRDSEGNLVWFMLGAPPITKSGYEIEFKAAGTIKVFSRVPAVPAEIEKFSLVYFWDP